MQETPQEYISRILGYQEGKKPLKVQQATAKKIKRLIKGIPRKKLMARPRATQWSVAEILAHIADTELVAGFRLRLVLGANGTTIQAFDQDVWAENFNYRKRDPWKSLEMFRILRENNLALLNSISKPMWDNFGMHTERGKETVSRIVEMFAGHDINHLTQIETTVKRK
jgi:hypothetical protein